MFQLNLKGCYQDYSDFLLLNDHYVAKLLIGVKPILTRVHGFPISYHFTSTAEKKLDSHF